MLTNEIMGVLALGILWVNVLLIAADALLRARDLGRLADRMRAGLVHGEASGPLATFTLVQTGRHGSSDEGDTKTIRFHDHAYESRVLGGSVGEAKLEATEACEVWVERAEIERAARCASVREFDAAYVEAKRGKGLRRTIAIEIGKGREVWVLPPSRESERPVVSTFEPLSWIGRARVEFALFAAMVIVLAAGCTALALVPPVFGLASMLGGAAGLALFLLAQPWGTAMRDRCKHASERPVRGIWERRRLASSAEVPAGAASE